MVIQGKMEGWTQVKMEGWTPQHVSHWLQTEFKIDDQQAAAIVQENIDGQALQLVTTQLLRADPFRIRIGDALKIVARIQSLQNVSGKKNPVCLQPKPIL
jgi:hypothetical protein